jgi:hypothetical protein
MYIVRCFSGKCGKERYKYLRDSVSTWRKISEKIILHLLLRGPSGRVVYCSWILYTDLRSYRCIFQQFKGRTNSMCTGFEVCTVQNGFSYTYILHMKSIIHSYCMTVLGMRWGLTIRSQQIFNNALHTLRYYAVAGLLLQHPYVFQILHIFLLLAWLGQVSSVL